MPPVGTILAYVGDLNKIPTNWHLCDGTNGTPDLRGRFLEGVTNDVGQFNSPGLPNIIGTVGPIQYQQYGMFKETGALFHIAGGWAWGSSFDFTQKDFTYGGQGYMPLAFDASRSNSIYGKASTVQPASYTVYYIMRTR